jgi:hypothetical protein
MACPPGEVRLPTRGGLRAPATTSASPTLAFFVAVSIANPVNGDWVSVAFGVTIVLAVGVRLWATGTRNLMVDPSSHPSANGPLRDTGRQRRHSGDLWQELLGYCRVAFVDPGAGLHSSTQETDTFFSPCSQWS